MPSCFYTIVVTFPPPISAVPFCRKQLHYLEFPHPTLAAVLAAMIRFRAGRSVSSSH